LDITKRKGKKVMTVSQTPGFRFTDLDAEEQDTLSAMKQSQFCLERLELTDEEKEFHYNVISRCAEELRKIWYPSK
jgi:hypothetical protein